MPITLLDGILIVIMLLSAVLAMIRGFVREVLSIASWVIAAVAAFFLYGQVLPFITPHINNDSVALGVSVAIVFLVTLIVVSYITMRISDFVLDSRIGALDRTLGFVFGALRGMLLVVVAMLFFNWFVPTPEQPQWIASAKSKPMLDAIGDQARCGTAGESGRHAHGAYPRPARAEQQQRPGGRGLHVRLG